MSISRREFVQLSLATGAAAVVLAGAAGEARGMTKVARPAPPLKADKALKILILGGTAFLGPAVVDAAKARGHSVTTFNRGKTEKRIGSLEGVEKRFGNRDPKLHADDEDPKSPQGLAELEQGEWDAVVDTSGYVPRIVAASAKLLAPRVKQYVFISTCSVYANNEKPDQTEDGALEKLTDETTEEVGKYYGGLKALCEKAAEDAMPGRVANIRPGYIVGPGDSSDRFTYWPVRALRGGEMLAPGTPDDPIQVIDVRDLAAFIILSIEKNLVGPYTLVGPVKPAKWGEVVAACVAAAKDKGVTTSPTWVPADFLEEQGVRIGADVPIWIPPTGEYGGFHRRSNAKAAAAGLTTRPLADTVQDLAAWWPKEVARRERVGRELAAAAEKAGKPAPKLGDPTKPRAGMVADKEAGVLKAWKEKK